MTSQASQEYLASAVLTAAPEQLQLMLYDGAIRFARQAREALSRRDWEAACEQLIRAQRIVTELRNGLRPEANPGLCEQLAALYTFVYNRLLDANLKHNVQAIDEALQILNHQRETWRMLIDKISRADAVGPAAAHREENAFQEPLSIHG